MAKNDPKDSYKKFILFVLGFFILILGITLTLAWWGAVIILFKGSVGIVLALAGLFMLYAMNRNS